VFTYRYDTSWLQTNSVYRDVNDRHADNMREEVPILGIGTEEWSSGRCGGSFWKYYRGDGRRRSHVWNASADLMVPSYDGNERHMDDTRKEVPMLGIVIEPSLSGRPGLQLPIISTLQGMVAAKEVPSLMLW